jgi:hypothetical protein
VRGYPRGFRTALWGVCALLLATGLLLAPTTLQLRLDWPLPWRLAAQARTGVAALHAAASLAMLVLAGALWSLHMRSGWRRGRQRRSGALLVAGLAGLTATALGVYYLGEAGSADLVALAHLGLGLAVVPLLALHTWRGRRLARAAAHLAALGPLWNRWTARPSALPGNGRTTGNRT